MELYLTILVPTVGVMAAVLIARGDRRAAARLAAHEAQEERRRAEHERLATVYRELYDAGAELALRLRLQHRLHVPRLLRLAALRRWTATGHPIGQLGQRRAALQLHGSPDEVLAAWDGVDEAVLELVDAHWRRQATDRADHALTMALAAFLDAGERHLSSVWPQARPEHRRDADLRTSSPAGVTAEASRGESDATTAERGHRGLHPWPIATSAAAVAVVLDQFPPADTPALLAVLFAVTALGAGWHLGRAAGIEGWGIGQLSPGAARWFKAGTIAVVSVVGVGGGVYQWVDQGPVAAALFVVAIAVVAGLMWRPDVEGQEHVREHARYVARGSAGALVAAIGAVLIFPREPSTLIWALGPAGGVLGFAAGWLDMRLRSRP